MPELLLEVQGVLCLQQQLVSGRLELYGHRIECLGHPSKLVPPFDWQWLRRLATPEISNTLHEMREWAKYLALEDEPRENGHGDRQTG